MTETVTVRTEGTTLPGLLARHYRKVFSGMVAKTFALNQDLARSGPLSPRGSNRDRDDTGGNGG
ncbi:MULTISPECIES: hypothetical protein [unclassified Mesorhizobium]|uniref:hypothetical protein n=1 Tax=unclassified Mesorhizobium TaxID=325217 RepID=UPI000FCA894E|nr:MULTISPECIES: hypothetical protein [unclassified Mesorhizobium]RUV21650.1 hypothetical protein EOA91_15055 [Mesorhizobium sp. M1A.F.Ca.IN.022.04.1.1]RWG37214.1 MAG: hypothetical protein EOQ60_01695 [Mesorhizobium sp.]